MTLLEKVFDIYLVSLYREGLRYINLKTLSVVVKGVKGLRQLTFIFYISVVSCLVFVGGLFIVLIQILNQMSQGGVMFFDPVIATGLVLIIFGASVMGWSLREKRWLEAFGLDQSISSLTFEHQKLDFDEKQIRDLVEALVEKKMKSLEYQSPLASDFQPSQSPRTYGSA